MTIASSFENGLLKIYIGGELDHHAAKKTMAYIEEKINAHLPGKTVLDLRDLSFMDSSGVAVVLKAYRRMKEIGGRISVENVGSQPRRVLAASGVERIVKITALSKEN